MESHPLPSLVQTRLRSVASAVAGIVESHSHVITAPRGIHEALDRKTVTSTARRALIVWAANSALHDPVLGHGVEISEVGQLGFDIVISDDETEESYAFRVRKAEVDRFNRLVVTTDSDSFVAKLMPPPPSFDDLDETGSIPDVGPIDRGTTHLWFLAYLVNPMTHTFSRLAAGRPTGYTNATSPYRLVLTDTVEIDLTLTPPPAFRGDRDDLFEDQERPDEGTGG